MIDVQTSELVNAIAIVESDVRQDAVGDGGRAISMYQIHEAFWLDVYDWRARNYSAECIANLPSLDIGAKWSDIGGNNQTGQRRATNCCTLGVLMLTQWLERRGAVASPENIYAAYTLGRTAFAACHLELNDPAFPAFKRAKCHRIGEIVRHAHQLNPAPHD